MDIITLANGWIFSVEESDENGGENADAHMSSDSAHVSRTRQLINVDHVRTTLARHGVHVPISTQLHLLPL